MSTDRSGPKKRAADAMKKAEAGKHGYVRSKGSSPKTGGKKK
jgi:hypothetical protein